MTRVTRLIHNAGKYLLISIYPLPTNPTHNFTHKNCGNLDTLPDWPKEFNHNRPARCAGQWINHCEWIGPSENRISKQERFVILKNRGAFSTLVWRHHTCTDVEILPGTHHCNGAQYLTTYMRECKWQRTILPENWHYFCFFYHQKNMLQIRMELTI